MLLKSYTTSFSRPGCNPSFTSLNCLVQLDQNISEVIPYLNTVFDADQYLSNPPSILCKVHGRLITITGNSIAINALSSKEEAAKILSWLQREINQTWQERETIQPRAYSKGKPQIIEVLKLLPKTNCGQCGQKTCMVAADLMCQGAYTAANCPEMSTENAIRLNTYLQDFHQE